MHIVLSLLLELHQELSLNSLKKMNGRITSHKVNVNSEWL